MEYHALYRKYRPQGFGEIIGQDHVTLTLAREIQGGRVPHAYLFAGPRGTGKTTTARIIAKALNCTDRAESGEPCNVCDSCVAVTAGTSLDVIELDAASHNKVEDIRDLRANVGAVASVGGASRVYILDEAHMLSRAASNALLKTLEEPPDHAYFVLATTEPYKLPDTIRSRAQRFDFHPIGSVTLTEHLRRIAGREGFAVDDDALSMLSRHAKGSARDALGLLEQVAALGAGKVDVRNVTRALGLATGDAYETLTRAIGASDAVAGLELISRLASDGADLRRFVVDAIEWFRGLFLAQYGRNLEEIVDEPPEVLDTWRTHARELTPVAVLRAVDVLGEALTALREGREERLVVELAVLRLTRPETDSDPAALLARVERLEDRLRRAGGAPTSPTPASSSAATSMQEEAAAALESENVVPGDATPAAAASASAESVPEVVEDPPAATESALTSVDENAAAPDEAPPGDAAPLDVADVDAIWPRLLTSVKDELGSRRHALFREARPIEVEDGDTVVLGVPGHLPFHLAQLEADQELADVIGRAAREALGRPVGFRYRGEDGAQPVLELDPETDRAPDKETLREANLSANDPAALLVDTFDGEIVSDD